MSQQDKSRYFQALKAAGVEFTKHYREYTTEELATKYRELQQAAPASPPPPDPTPELDADAAAFFGVTPPQPEPVAPAPTRPAIEQREADPNEMAGQRLNTQGDEPIRVDEQGRVWFQEEVRKPAYPKPRGRRVLRYMDTGVKTQTVKNGDYLESFEVAGDIQREAEVKITLPSYQVGCYKDPRFPFRIHVYNSKQGFDLFEVQKYYGGSELVPASILKTYVENVLCYDIRTTIRTIQHEYRQLQLAGKVQ